jgi:hypothetical protein
MVKTLAFKTIRSVSTVRAAGICDNVLASTRGGDSVPAKPVAARLMNRRRL